MEHSSQKRAIGFFARHNRQFTTAFLLVIFIIATIAAVSGRSGSVTVQLDEGMLGVLGSYGDPAFIQLEEITQVRLADTVAFGGMLEGEEKKNTLSGVYENDAFGTYTLHVYKESAPYIVVSYGGGILVFNQRTAKQTRDIYDDLAERSAQFMLKTEGGLP